MEIKEFYSGNNVFITGGTGFMGKVLIEKLIRSCPGICKIYVLIRNRKDKDINTRIRDMLALPLFEKIRTEQPGFSEKKIIPVLGDLSEVRLGLSDDDYNALITNISIVFHVAATVRFDEPLRDAIIKNVRGTREIVALSKLMKNLKVFLHVSTTYSNCNRIYVEEKVYESPVSWQNAILIAENFNMRLTDILTTKFLGSFPNTYTFTKLLAEQIISEQARNNMPMVIFRPSIVISTYNEPVVGWVDNVNGPVGLMVACGKGVALVTLAKKDIVPDFMAVDISIKAMIVAAYHRGTQDSSTYNQLPVYNSSSVGISITNNKLLQLAVKYFMLHPFDEILWRPRILITGSKFIYYVLTLLQQVLPAVLIDFAMKTIGKQQKINLLKLQRKIYIATIELSKFTLRTWTFVNTQFLGLLKHIPQTEHSDFDFSFDNVEPELVFKNCIIGTQKYLFNTNPKKIRQATKKLRRLVWIDRILTTLFFALIAWCLKSFISFLLKLF